MRAILCVGMARFNACHTEPGVNDNSSAGTERYAAAPTRSRKPVTPATSAQCSQQKNVPSFSSP
jgi:hypothetical protein